MDSDRRTRLEEKFKEFVSVPMIKIGRFVELEEADVDLFEEDSYVAGLVDRFLNTGAIEPYDRIELNSTIDERLRRAIESHPTAQQSIRNLQRYRERLVDLASTLSQACGVPIEWK